MSVVAKIVRAVDRYWYAPAPSERPAVLRIAVGGFALVYLAVRFGSFTRLARFDATQFAPVGPIAVLLSEPLSPPLLLALTLATLACAVPFVLGLYYRLTAPLFAGLFLLLTSYRSSWGMTFHTENLVCLHLLVLAFAPAADALSLDARRRPRVLEAHGRYGWAGRALSAITVVTYVLAGLAKVRLGGAGWMSGELLQAQIAYDNLRKIELGSFHSPLGAALVTETWLFAVLSWLTLVVELGAPVALAGGKLALGWALSAFGFHLGVVALMAIAFPYPLSFVAYLSLFRAERVLGARIFGRVSPRAFFSPEAPHARPVARD
ncbi:MAG TPA: HTTM domain-containing protein [Polyangiaceae bacterium]|nr:HTTM domain-containing protein [Polyangiaceae bacterium]